jgi:hypothetical protein
MSDPRLSTLIEEARTEVARLNQELKAAKKRLKKLEAAADLGGAK